LIIREVKEDVRMTQEVRYPFPCQDAMLLKLKIMFEELKLRVRRLTPKEVNMDLLLQQGLESL
jgi:hypothetical protein